MEQREMNNEQERQELMNKNRRLVSEVDELTQVNKSLVNTLLAIKFTKPNDTDLVTTINKIFDDIKK